MVAMDRATAYSNRSGKTSNVDKRWRSMEVAGKGGGRKDCQVEKGP